jgi:glycosyltransferase involved in cell wall biosynthesis
MNTRIAVVMPVFNGQAEFDKTLATLARSTIRCHIIVVDDGSDPPLVAGGSGLTLIRLDQNQGIVAALNTGMQLALERGYEYIARMDAGDLAHPERFERQFAYLEENPKCMLVSCDVDVIGANGEYDFTIKPPRHAAALATALKERVWLLHSTVMFRASVFRETGLYTNEFDAAEDYDLFMRIASRFPIGVVPETLVICPRTPQGISTVKARVQLTSRLRIQMRHFDPRSPTAWYGVVRTLIALVLTQRFRIWMKRLFIYPRLCTDRNRNEVSSIPDRVQYQEPYSE